jgi:hypothetical protein
MEIKLPETALAVPEGSSEISTNMPKEEEIQQLKQAS